MVNNESKLSQILSQIEFIELGLPNLLSDRVPDGKNESDNEVIRSWGNKKEFSFPVKDHVELGSNLGLLDMDNAARISGSRFSVLRGNLASLQRALIQFMLDIHINEHGYEEFYVPFIVNSETLTGTSQLPKFESDLFKIESDKSLYLIPTAEVPLTNLFGDQIIDITKNSGRPDAKMSANDPETFSEYQFSVNNLEQFDGFNIKVVTSSTNESTPVKLKDFRCIALA